MSELAPTVAVAGSREYPVLTDVDDFIAELASTTVVLSGGARGVDRRATERARLRGLKALDLRADWNNLPRDVAGYIRNSEMVRRGDYVVAFWDERSNGTLDTIVKAVDHGEKLYAVIVRRAAETPREVIKAEEFVRRYRVQLAAARQRYIKRGCWDSAI